MPLSQQFITPQTPMGATLNAEGATFRVWAPKANAVHLCGNFQGGNNWTPSEDNKLIKDANGYWAGFLPGVKDGDQYKFFIDGVGSDGFKRDPFARELTDDNPPYPRSNCIVRDPHTYPWHDHGFSPPRFHEMVIYQLHIGVYYGTKRAESEAKYLDVLDRLDYLLDLGINAIQLLPVVEFVADDSLGYDGSDLFSTEMDYHVEPSDLPKYLDKINKLLARRTQLPLTLDQLAVPINQLKTLPI
jgi:1,4-alpha-glucan branching enzyme